LLPSINSSITVDTSLQNFSSFGIDASSFDEQLSNFTINPNSSTTRFGVGLQWEIDIWGRLLNAKKAAKKDYKATEYDLSFLALSSLIRSIQAYIKKD
jgi:outer membrane protein TolC